MALPAYSPFGVNSPAVKAARTCFVASALGILYRKETRFCHFKISKMIQDTQ
jgi:hypothetical protein